MRHFYSDIAAVHNNQLDSCLAKHDSSAVGSVKSFDHLLYVNLEVMVDGVLLHQLVSSSFPFGLYHGHAHDRECGDEAE